MAFSAPHPFRLARASRLAMAVLACLAGVGTTRAAAGAARPAAVAAELTGDTDRTTLAITLTEPVAVSGFVLEGPDRAVIELPLTRIALGEDGRRPVGLASSLRWGTAGPGRSRVVVELTRPAVIARSDLEPGPVAGTWRLTVELARADRAVFRRAAAGAGRDPETTGSLPSPSGGAPPRPVVVVDAGHGGSDTGARSASGALEKDVTLAFARAMRDALAASGRYRVLATREGDVFVPLDERVRLARAAGADLFISVHADSISRPTVSGATIYTGAEGASDPESERLAERENRADAVGAAGPTGPPRDVATILHDLTARETRGVSNRFAQVLHGALAPAIRFGAQPLREAGFRVLRAAEVPAVLVELGYLTNARDAELLASEGWRRRTADAMAGAVERFFAGRTAPPGRPAAHAAVSP